jgi:hypothetical protein
MENSTHDFEIMGRHEIPIGLSKRDTPTLLQFDFAIQLCYANIK